jgi:hypothetical protein
MQDNYQTTAAYISGGICGNLWMPQAPAGICVNANARGPFGLFNRFTEPASFRDALLLLLSERGGDFRSAEFTADTVFRVERRKITAPGKYEIHVWEREISSLPGCADLVNSEAHTADFMGCED